MSKIKLNSKEFANAVLQIAHDKKGVIVYHDFDRLNPKPFDPLNPKPKDGRFLHYVKKVLIYNSYICHERNKKTTWGCDYCWKHTHFHKIRVTPYKQSSSSDIFDQFFGSTTRT